MRGKIGRPIIGQLINWGKLLLASLINDLILSLLYGVTLLYHGAGLFLFPPLALFTHF